MITLAGLVIGSLQLSGLTFKLSLILVSLSGGNVVALLALTAVVCILLDVAANRGGLHHSGRSRRSGSRAARHRSPRRASFSFLLRHALLITPPDCLATYTAAAIAHSDFEKPAGPACALVLPRTSCRSSSPCILR